MAKKLTTEEILAACRAQGALGSGGSGAAEAPASASPPPSKAAEPAAPAAPASGGGKPVATPGSTADILAAARAQKAAGAAKPAAPSGGGAPKSPSDILAAARAQGAGGGAAKKPAATPGSTSDILAAARAQKAGGGGGAAVKPAAGKAAAKGGAPAKKVGSAKTVAEMLAAARKADSGDSQDDKPKGDTEFNKPKLPAKKLADVKSKAKPAPKPKAKAKKGQKDDRRWFMAALAVIFAPFVLGLGMLTGAVSLFGLGVARFMMPNVLVEPPTKFKIGSPGDYPEGTVSTKWKSARAIWVVNTVYKGNPMIYALSTVCTHLGCTPSWLEGEQKFKCPCHGSGFYINGVNFEGPAPRPLERYGLRLAEDGMLEVDKSVKFQEEMGQWEDAASFYPLA